MGGEQRLFADPAPSQPSQALLFLEWPLWLLLTQLRLADTEWLCFVFASPGGLNERPYVPPQTLHMRPITFRIYKFSLEGLGKASSAQEARRAAASIAGCMSLTAKYGQLTVGPCFFIATRPSAPGTKAHQPGPVQKLSYNFNIKTKTSIVASLLLVLRHLETFSVLFPRHSPAIARRAFHLFWLLASKLCPRAVTFNEALASD